MFCFYLQVAGGDSKLAVSLGEGAVQQDLYAAVSAASSWLDSAENQLLSGPVLLSEDTETQLCHLEVSSLTSSVPTQRNVVHCHIKHSRKDQNICTLRSVAFQQITH